jgi:hypothetical protein
MLQCKLHPRVCGIFCTALGTEARATLRKFAEKELVGMSVEWIEDLRHQTVSDPLSDVAYIAVRAKREE